MHVFLETERLLLRRFTDVDGEHLFDLDSDPEVMRFINGGTPTPREVIEQVILPRFLSYYERFAGYGHWAAIEKATGEFVGWFGFQPREGARLDEVELGYRLRQAAWGRGYGTEASRALIRRGFTELGVRRVVASTYGENLASRRVMEKVGMRLVRTFRMTPDELFTVCGVTSPDVFDGDDVEYALEKPDWEQQEGAGGRG